MLKEAQDLLLKQSHVESSEADWAYESVKMEKAELDRKTLPKEGQLPDLVMTHVYQFDDGRAEDDYTVYFITNATSELEYIRGLLLNGELIWHQTSDHQE